MLEEAGLEMGQVLVAWLSPGNCVPVGRFHSTLVVLHLPDAVTL